MVNRQAQMHIGRRFYVVINNRFRTLKEANVTPQSVNRSTITEIPDYDVKYRSGPIQQLVHYPLISMCVCGDDASCMTLLTVKKE